jgi:hypothetical protein
MRPKVAAGVENIAELSEHKQNEAKPKVKAKAKAKAGVALSIPLLVAASILGEAQSAKRLGVDLAR